MNLPNKLTILRILMVPVFLFILLIESIPHHFIWALIIFSVASITDLLDGYLARKNNLITNFGKFLDPLADKILVMAALVCFVEKGLIGSIPVVIILTREFMVSGLRLVTANEGIVVAAGIWGKLKTAFTMVAIVVILLLAEYNLNGTISFSTEILNNILIWIATVLTIISGLKYLWGYRKYINTSK